MIAQLIPAAMSPILTRIYSPLEIGQFTSFFAISVIIGTVINLRYDFSILSAGSDSEIFSLGKLSIATATILTALLLIVAFPAMTILKSTTIVQFPIGWLVAVPLLVFIIGINNTLQQINTRLGRYSTLTRSYILKSVTSSTSQPTLGLLGFNALGLVFGLMVAEAIGTLALLKGLTTRLSLRAHQLRELLPLAKRYKKFPLISTWSALINALSQNSPIIIIAALFHGKEAGLYAIVYRILSLPISMLGNALSKIYSEEAADEKAKTTKATQAFKKTILLALAIALPLFIIIFLSIEKLIPIVFGEEWTEAGKLAILLIPLLCSRFVAFTISTTNSIFERQSLELFWNISLIAIIACCTFLSATNEWSFHSFTKAYSYSTAAHYLILIGISWSVVRKEKGDF